MLTVESMKAQFSDWPSLHDATLMAILFDWGSGEVRVRLLLSDESAQEAEIVVRACRMLRCPRKESWGPSVSINEVRWLLSEQHGPRLEIEVQSGDVIEIEGGEVGLCVVDAAASG